MPANNGNLRYYPIGQLAATHHRWLPQRGVIDYAVSASAANGRSRAAASAGIAAASVARATVAAATPNFSGPSDTCYHGLVDDILTEKLAFDGGRIKVPKGPGLGVEVDEAKIEKSRMQ